MLDAAFLIWNTSSMFSLFDVRVFVHVADTGGVSAAARTLDMPKSSVSRALSQLEVSVGAMLVERSSQGVRLSDAGGLFLPYARRLLTEAEEAQTAVDTLAEAPRGTLRISAGVTVGIGLIGPMLPLFLSRNPELHVVLNTENRVADLVREDVDVAIRIGELEDSDLIVRMLGSIDLWLCASPAYLAARGTPHTPGDLAGHRLVDWRADGEPWRFRDAAGQRSEVKVPPGTVIPEPSVLVTLLQAGWGMGRLPSFLAARLVRTNELIRLLPHYEGERVALSAVYTQVRGLSPRVRVFVDALAWAVRDFIRGG